MVYIHNRTATIHLEKVFNPLSPALPKFHLNSTFFSMGFPNSDSQSLTMPRNDWTWVRLKLKNSLRHNENQDETHA